MIKKLGFILGLFCCIATHAVASENLIESLRAEYNTTIVDGVMRQRNADSAPNVRWKLQAWFGNDRHSTQVGENVTIERLFSLIDGSLGFISATFPTPADMDDFMYFRFALDGKERDTSVLFYIKDVMPRTTYTIQWRVLNNTQGEVAWTDMFVTRCGDGYSLALGDENCSRECENQSVTGGNIPPDVARVYEPEICTYDQSRLVCDEGYVRRGNECAQLCTGGMRYIKTSNGLQFNLYQVAYSTPALHVKRGDTVCHAVLAPGTAKNSINVNHNGQIYHTVD